MLYVAYGHQKPFLHHPSVTLYEGTDRQAAQDAALAFVRETEWSRAEATVKHGAGVYGPQIIEYDRGQANPNDPAIAARISWRYGWAFAWNRLDA